MHVLEAPLRHMRSISVMTPFPSIEKVPALLWHFLAGCLRRRLAALPVTTPTRPHLASIIRHSPSVICHLPSVICHLPSVIAHSPFPVPNFLVALQSCRSWPSLRGKKQFRSRPYSQDAP